MPEQQQLRARAERAEEKDGEEEGSQVCEKGEVVVLFGHGIIGLKR